MVSGLVTSPKDQFKTSSGDASLIIRALKSCKLVCSILIKIYLAASAYSRKLLLEIAGKTLYFTLALALVALLTSVMGFFSSGCSFLVISIFKASPFNSFTSTLNEAGIFGFRIGSPLMIA